MWPFFEQVHRINMHQQSATESICISKVPQNQYVTESICIDQQSVTESICIDQQSVTESISIDQQSVIQLTFSMDLGPRHVRITSAMVWNAEDKINVPVYHYPYNIRNGLQRRRQNKCISLSLSDCFSPLINDHTIQMCQIF